MKIILYLFVVSLTISVSCNDKKTDNESVTKNNRGKSGKLIDLDLPIYIDSTDYLMIPASILRNSKKSLTRELGDYEWYSSNYINFIFKNRDTNKQKLLSDKNINIINYSISYDFYYPNKKVYIFYKIIIKDTNGDHKINSYDALSLFFSTSDGLNFKQITSEKYSVISYNFDGKFNKIYIKAYEDSDKNKTFDSKDKTVILEYDLANNNGANISIDEKILEKINVL